MKFIIYSLIAHIIFFGSLWILKNSYKQKLFNTKTVVLNVDFISPIPETPSPKPVLKKTKTTRIEKPEVKVEKKEKTLAVKKVVEKKKKEETPPIKNESKMFKKGATVDMSNFKYDYYLNLIQSRMYLNFHPPYNLNIDDKVVMLYFVIEANGKISKIEFEKKSKSELLNRLAKRAVENSKLPPLPPRFVKDGGNSLGVHFTFIYEDKK